jgi:ribonuclease HI
VSGCEDEFVGKPVSVRGVAADLRDRARAVHPDGHAFGGMAHEVRYIEPADGALTVFTDGSSLPGRRGGVGIKFVSVNPTGVPTEWDVSVAGVRSATNNEMELLAVITAMKEIQGKRFPREILAVATRIDIYTDSMYVVDHVGTAIGTWPRTKWMTREGRPVENVELWKDLVRELRKLRGIRRTEIKWAKGHSRDNPHNKDADTLAKASAKGPLRDPLKPVSVRRKKTSERLERGSVAMLGQRLTIRIVGAELMREHGVHKLQYEVMSRRSPFFGKSDVAYTDDVRMRPGHTYRVTMGKDQGYPKIAKMHVEILDEKS